MEKSALQGEELNRELGTAGVVWRLEDLYPAPRGAEMEEDRNRAQALAGELAREFKGRVAELTPEELLRLVEGVERVSTLLGRLATYAYLHFATQVEEPGAGALLQEIKEFSSQVEAQLLFFELEWAQVEEEGARALLDHPELARYRHYLQAARRYRPHLLSEPEERLLMLKAPVGRSSWISLFEKVMASQRYGDGKTQEEVLTLLYSPDREVRRRAARELTEGLKQGLQVVTHTINTILADKMIEDRLRNYPTWISSMNLANELDDETVEGLVSAVTSAYPTVARYYRLKERLLGISPLYDYDRYAPLPDLPQRRFTWEECREMVLGAYRAFSPEMAEIADLFFQGGWIHAPVAPGKSSGAFAHPAVPEVHPYVMVNYTGTFRDIETVAHELGHGVHQYLAREQGYLNAHTPLVLAETASVFGEMLTFARLMEEVEGPRARLGLLCSKIESIFATVFRQIAMNRFEEAIHNHRRSRGELSPQELCRYWMETQEAMFQGSVVLTDDYGVWWSYIGHFLHTPGYVYAYAFGELLVLSLYGLYRRGEPDFVENYLRLLRAGGNGSPYELLAPFGIDLRDPGFWRRGLAVIEEMVGEAEGLEGALEG